MDKIAIIDDRHAEAIVTYIMNNLPDETIDGIELERISPISGGVAREVITTAAVLTLVPTVTVAVVRLIERWMEINRQQKSTQFIYEASKANPAALKALAELERKHTETFVKYGQIGDPRTKHSGKN